MGKDNHLRRINVQASIVGKSGSSTFQTALRFGSTVYEHGHVVKYFTGAELVLPRNNTEYQILLESKVKYPKITTRWNTSKLLEEDLNMEVTGRLSYGLKNHPEDVQFRGSLRKTEDQKKEVRASKDYKECLEQERHHAHLAQTCLRVRHQGSSVDEFKLAMQFPRKASQEPITRFLEQALKFSFFWELSKEEPNSSVVTSDRELVISLNLSLDGASADLQVDRSDLSQLYKNIRIPKCLNGILPLGLRKHFASHLFQKLSHDQVISSCRIENGNIQTFDQKSFRYDLNDCNHLLFRDCSGKVPVAVLAKTEPVAKTSKVLEILSGVSHLIIRSKNPKVPGDLIIESKVAKKHTKFIELKNSSSTHFEVCSETKDVLFDIRRYSDNVYSFWFHKELLQVITDGVRIQIFAPQRVQGDVCGLCGDFDGELSPEFQSPERCHLKTGKHFGFSFMLDKDHCSGIPSQERDDFKSELKKCVTATNSVTDVKKIARDVSQLSRPNISIHLVKKRSKSKVCFSRQRMTLMSTQRSRRRQIFDDAILRSKIVAFSCVASPSDVATSLERRADRGEDLEVELNGLPVDFTSVEYEPETSMN